jgi:hypothetical protein
VRIKQKSKNKSVLLLAESLDPVVLVVQADRVIDGRVDIARPLPSPGFEGAMETIYKIAAFDKLMFLLCDSRCRAG